MFYYKNPRTGFFSNELNVYTESCSVVPDKRHFFEECENDGNYNIIFVASGAFVFKCGRSVTELSYGDIAITRPFENFKLFTKHSLHADKISEFRVTIISFLPTLFSQTKGDDDFLRAFTEREKGENNIIRKSEFCDYEIGEGIFFRFQKYTQQNMGFFHFQSAVAMVISQLCMIFDEQNDVSVSETSNEYQLRIFDYICRNSANKITIEKLSEKFSVSSWYINNVTRKFYGSSFRETVKSMRMFSAREMMKHNDDLAEISQLCGYSTYSNFYRNYLNFFRISPKNDRIFYKKHNDYYNYATDEEK